MKYISLRLAFLLILCSGLAGCEKKVADNSTVSIQNTKPSGDAPLLAGEEIKFDIGILTRNAPEGSSVGLVIQGADDSLLGIAEPVKVKNGHEIQISLKALIPLTTSVNVFAALYGDANKDSIAVDSRTFKVIGNKK
jgi:hypothetical protein